MKVMPSVGEWLSVANERTADAEAIFQGRGTSAGSIYMVGYGIECSLKAYLKASGLPLPQSGPGGHNLVALWKRSGFRKRDIGGHLGSCTFYFELWHTGMRYFSELDLNGMTHAELLIGARQITGWLQTQVRRKMRKGR